MGLFQHRPEEPTEWAGLPAEPLPERDSADLLRDAPTLGDAVSVTALTGTSHFDEIPLLGEIPPRQTSAWVAQPGPEAAHPSFNAGSSDVDDAD